MKCVAPASAKSEAALAAEDDADEPDFIVPARPTASNPGEFQRPGVLQLEPSFSKPGLELRHAGRGPAVEQRRPVGGVEQVDADHALAPEVPQVEGLSHAHARMLWAPPVQFRHSV